MSDDASPDDSCSIVRAAMAADARVRLIEAPVNAGPAAARNRALDAATGDWVAMIDSDDLLHPQRIERMVAASERLQADMVADDMVFFGDTLDAGGRTLLQPLGLRSPLAVTPDLFLEASGESGRVPALGYLKPLIKRSRIGALRYDESLRIGEDYDFVLRLLLAGLQFQVLPDPMYLYRRHGGSISHRLSEAAAAAMLGAHDRVADGAMPGLRPALEQRRRGLLAMWRYERLVASIRGRRIGAAAAMVLRHPGLALDLGRSAAERIARSPQAPDPGLHKAELQLGLGLPHADRPPLSVPSLAPPLPGKEWSAPPAPMAAALSRLSARYELLPVVLDDAGAWAAGLLPSAKSG